MGTIKREFLKLNNSGIAHYLVPIVAVLIVSVAGTYFLVASHANPISPMKIMYVKPSIGYLRGHAVGNNWCVNTPQARVVERLRVTTSGTIDSVMVVTKTNVGDPGINTRLTYRGKNVWTGSVNNYSVCTSKKGGTATLPGPFVYYKVSAVYGPKSVSSNVPFKSVVIH